MFNSNRLWMLVVVACLAVLGSACRPKTAAKPEEREKQRAASPRDNESGEEQAPRNNAARKPKPDQPPPPPTIPKVMLSNELRATCLVDVGQTLPPAELPDLTGKIHALDSLYGQKLSVVCLWSIGTTRRSQLVAAEILRDLAGEIVEPFGKKGVRVIGINVGDAAATVEKALGEADVAFPCLLDPKGEYLAKITTDKRTPRIFLLDAEGRVLWFDIGRSRQSRSDLVQSIRVALGEL